jgi:hypothetical protein
MRITLTPDVERALTAEARRQGTTPEQLALESLRQLFVPPEASGLPAERDTLFDFLSDYIGTVSGTTEALSKKGEKVS